MGQVVVLSQPFVTVNCGECGGVYAIGERFHQQCREMSRSWTCPYCGIGWGFGGETEAQRLKKQLEVERERRERALADANHERHRANALKGHLTRLRNRVGNGVCPCCNRTFQNLARHIKKKHPEFCHDET